MKDRIKYLEDQITKHSNYYYNSESKISDASFDEMTDELAKIDPSNVILSKVGAPVGDDDGWKKAKHDIPMGSLNKVSSKQAMDAWIDRYINDNDVFFIEKIDGLSIEILYEDGKLISAISRGDGIWGDEISSNVRKMHGVKETLPLLFTGSLRGEIILTKENYRKHFSDKSNVRNTAAGVSRRLDGEGSEHLSIIFYQAIGNVELETEMEQLSYLKENLGLTTPNYGAYEPSSNNAKEYIDSIYTEYSKSIREELDYEIDGLVIKINNLSKQDEQGITDNRPKGAIAYKFPHDMKETILRDVVWQVGNSGRIVPIAVFDEILLAGAMVERASLHNIGRIKELGILIGDKILVSRRNDVIPHIECKVE